MSDLEVLQAHQSASIFPIPAFVINLPQDVERRFSTLTSLAAAGIVAQIWEAFDGGTLSPDQVRAVARRSLRTEGRALFAGEIGTAISHLSVYEHMIEHDIDVALVLEDDVLVGPKFVGVVKSLLAARSRPDGLGFDLVNFITDAKQIPLARIDDDHDLTAFAGAANRSACVLLTLEGARKLLAAGRPIRYPSDGLSGRTWVTGIDSKGVVPPVASLAGFRSTIERTSHRRGVSLPEWMYRKWLLTRRLLAHIGLR